MKFFNLLKKELAELINAQAIATLVVVFAIFSILGNVMNSTIEEATKQDYTVNICDQDRTDFTASLIEKLRSGGAEINECNSESDDYYKIIEASGKQSVIIIPEGFTESIEKGEKPELISVSEMKSTAVVSNMSNSNSGALNLISLYISDTFSEKFGIGKADLSTIQSPITITEQTVVGKESAEIGIDTLVSQLATKNMILPIIVFVLITMVSQMIMNAIANEKIDKTLETLLSTPVSRMSILNAKMLAAAIVAILNAIAFMLGFSSFMSGATETVSSEFADSAVQQYTSVNNALETLGLNLSAGDYILVGLQLFLTIMICLSVSIMLGAIVSDIKQSQTMIMPLLFMAMIPYIISMVSDINTLPMAARIIIYAIPFTHTFLSMSNIMFGNMGIFFGGLAYQAVIFVVCMFFAIKLFKSDIILTASLNFGQKSKFKKSKKSEE